MTRPRIQQRNESFGGHETTFLVISVMTIHDCYSRTGWLSDSVVCCISPRKSDASSLYHNNPGATNLPLFGKSKKMQKQVPENETGQYLRVMSRRD